MTHHIQLDQLMTNENNFKIEKKDDLIINILLEVNLELDSILAKPYSPTKSF